MNHMTVQFTLRRFTLYTLTVLMLLACGYGLAFSGSIKQFCGEKCASQLAVFEKRTGKPAPKHALGRCLDYCQKTMKSCRQNCQKIVAAYKKGSGRDASPRGLQVCLQHCGDWMNITNRKQLARHCWSRCTKIPAAMGLNPTPAETKECIAKCSGQASQASRQQKRK